MGTLKFKIHLRIVFFTAVNHNYGNNQQTMKKNNKQNGSESSNHNWQTWPSDRVEVNFCFPRGPRRWLTAAKRGLHFRVRISLKTPINWAKGASDHGKHYLIVLQDMFTEQGKTRNGNTCVTQMDILIHNKKGKRFSIWGRWPSTTAFTHFRHHHHHSHCFVMSTAVIESTLC